MGSKLDNSVSELGNSYIATGTFEVWLDYIIWTPNFLFNICALEAKQNIEEVFNEQSLLDFWRMGPQIPLVDVSNLLTL